MPDLARHELRHADGRRLWVYGPLRGELPADEPAGDPAAGLHQRYDALTDAWIAISPGRNTRPNTASSGAAGGAPAAGSAPAAASAPATAPESGPRPSCPLCPGGPEIPFPFEAATFENRWPTFGPEPHPPPDPADPWQAPSRGRSEVIVYTPEHEGSLATLSPERLANVIAIWTDRTAAAWSDPAIRYVLAFENRGTAVGATIAHPHGQLFAFDRLPPNQQRRVAALARHRQETGACLTCAVLDRERGAPQRQVDDDATGAWHVGVPFAPRWPYEVHVRATRHGARRLADLTGDERRALAGHLRRAVLRYDALFGFELPFMMEVLEAPADAEDHHLAVEFWPPHRTAHLTKVRASVETATGLFINDTLPEASAAALRAIVVPAGDEAPPARVVPLAPGT